jgi:hypothetical protein
MDNVSYYLHSVEAKFEFIEFSMVSTGASIPFLKPFDKPRFQALKLW